jgi:hypothetical protein
VENREYVEREDEFDVNERPDEQEGVGAGGRCSRLGRRLVDGQDAEAPGQRGTGTP